MVDPRTVSRGDRSFILVKNGLYYTPGRRGLTSTKKLAGRFHEIEALGLVGVTAVHEDKISEYLADD